MNGIKKSSNDNPRSWMVLLEKVKNHDSLPLQTEALFNLVNLCQYNHFKRFLTKSKGFKIILEVLYTSNVNTIKEASLKALSFYADNTVESQIIFCIPNLFIFVDNILNDTSSKILLKTALFFLSSVIQQNRFGQTLSRESNCLTSVLQLFKYYKPTACDTKTFEPSFNIWRNVVSLLHFCVNTPKNEENQLICSAVLPDLVQLIHTDTKDCVLLPAITLLMCIIENNEINKKKFEETNGLEAIIKVLVEEYNKVERNPYVQKVVEYLLMLLDVSIFENVHNIQKLSILNAVPLLIDYFRKSLSFSTKLQILIILGHITENNAINRNQLLECNAFQTLKIMMDSDITDISIAGIFLLRNIFSPEIPSNTPSENEIVSCSYVRNDETKTLLKPETPKSSIFPSISVRASKLQNKNSLCRMISSKDRSSHVSSSFHSHMPNEIKSSAQGDPAPSGQPNVLISKILCKHHFQCLHLPTESLGCLSGCRNHLPSTTNQKNVFNIHNPVDQQSRCCMCNHFHRETVACIQRYSCHNNILPSVKGPHFCCNSQELNNCCCESCIPTHRVCRQHNADIKSRIRENVKLAHSQEEIISDLESQGYKSLANSNKQSTSSSFRKNNTKSSFKMPLAPKAKNKDEAILMNSEKIASNCTNELSHSSISAIKEAINPVILEHSMSIADFSMDSKEAELATKKQRSENKKNARIKKSTKATAVQEQLPDSTELFELEKNSCSLKPDSDSVINHKICLADIWKVKKKGEFSYLHSVASSTMAISGNQETVLVKETQKQVTKNSVSELVTSDSSVDIDVCDEAQDAISSSNSTNRSHQSQEKKVVGKKLKAKKSDVYSLDEKADFPEKLPSSGSTPNIVMMEEPSKRRKRIDYTKDELKYLSEGVEIYGEDFQKIRWAYKFHPSRRAVDLYNKWRKLKKAANGKTKKNKKSAVKPFSDTEIKNLEKGVVKYGHRWTLIRKRFEFARDRTPQQLREKWRNMTKYFPWTNVQYL